MQLSTVSSADAPGATIERIRRDPASVGLVFYNKGGGPLDISNTQFEFTIEDAGAVLLTKTVFTRPVFNKLVIQLTNAEKALMPKNRYTFTLFNTTSLRTELVGVWAWKRPTANATAVLNPADIRIEYDTVTGQVTVNGVVFQGQQGPRGWKGWSPVLAGVSDGQRRVQQVTDWIGGEDAKPPTGLYVGPNGYTPDIALATDLRGPQGVQGLPGNGVASTATSPADGGPAVRWIPILELPAQTAGTFDVARVLIVIGPWASNRQTIEMQVGNRDSFTYRWTSEGPATPGASVEAYQLADGRTLLYARLDHAFKTLAVVVPVLMGGVFVYSSMMHITGSPSGTKVFDSALPATYPPMMTIWATRRVSIGTDTPGDAWLNIGVTAGQAGVKIGSDTWLPFFDGRNYLRGTTLLADNQQADKVGIGTNLPDVKLDISERNVTDGVIIRVNNLHNEGPNRKGAKIRFHQSGVAMWQVGVDGEADAFMIQGWAGGAFPIYVLIDGSGNVAIGSFSPQEKLDVGGRIRARGLVSSGNMPSITAGAGAGPGATVTGINGNDMAGRFTLNTGNSSSATVLATFSFATAYASAPKAIVLTPLNSVACEQVSQVFVDGSTITASGFQIRARSGLNLNTAYQYQYVVIA